MADPPWTPITVLLIEDDPGDADLIREVLADDPQHPFVLEHVERLEAGLTRLSRGQVDVVLTDLSLPDSQGFDTFSKVREHAPQLPIVVLTGFDDEALAVEAVRSGAQDYLIKGQADGKLLSRVLRYAVERKGLENTIQRKARELLQLKDDFVSTVSHELRTPLSVIREVTALLLNESLGAITDEQRRYLTMSEEYLERFGGLLDNLLDLSKMEAKQLILTRRPVDLAQLIAKLCEPYQTMKTQRVICRLDAVPPVLADPDRIVQVLTNLLSNAIKFTPSDGTITIGLAEQDGRVACSVTDTGSGIPPEDLGRLFQKFQQLTDPSGERPRGTGLGLAICKQLVELHGGAISVQSAPGRGTTFTFTLPIYQPDSPALQT